MKDIHNDISKLAANDFRKNKVFFTSLKKNPPSNLDAQVHDLHDKVFSKINCLECANCCRTLGPRITDKDIERIAKYLKIKPSQLFEKYLRLDEDNDYVFKSLPCPFLGADNYCTVYEVRPAACKNYPHTDRKKFIQLLDITLKNTAVCPGVYEIVKELRGK